MLTSAVLTSARFPYITPPALLRLPDSRFLRSNRPCRRWEQIVDGGYIDNEGVLTIRDLLTRLLIGDAPAAGAESTRAELKEFKRAYRVIVIRLSAEPAPLSDPEDDEQSISKRHAPPARDSWDQPFSTVMKERAAAGQHLVRDFHGQIVQRLGGCWIEFNALDDDAPLGWTLSKHSRRRLDAWLDGPSSNAWKKLHKNDSGQRYERLKARGDAVDIQGKLQAIGKLLDDGNAACPAAGGSADR